MAAKTIVVGLVILLLAAPCLVDRASAAPIPSYLEGELWSIMCVRATVPALGTTPINVLLLLTFDPGFNGGIDLAEANELFSSFETQLAFGGGLVAKTCAFTPGKIQTDLPNITALQAAQTLSGQFKQLGFSLLFIVDTFRYPPAEHLELPEGTLVIRNDVFAVTGPNDATYTRSAESLGGLGF